VRISFWGGTVGQRWRPDQDVGDQIESNRRGLGAVRDRMESGWRGVGVLEGSDSGLSQVGGAWVSVGGVGAWNHGVGGTRVLPSKTPRPVGIFSAQGPCQARHQGQPVEVAVQLGRN
jgi:hypothetical protein